MSRDRSIELERGLPANLDAERFVLGSILLDDSAFVGVAGDLSVGDFVLDKHRTIWRRMLDLHGRGEVIDRVTLANELMRFNELERVDGLTYLVSLDDGLPRIPNLDSYSGIIREKAQLRQIITLSQQTMNRALLAEEYAADILSSAEEGLLRISDGTRSTGIQSVSRIMDDYPGGIAALLSPGSAESGLQTGFSKLDEMTNGLKEGELIIIGARPSMGKTALALNMAAFASMHRQKRGAFFSLEMSKESLIQRLLTSEARVDQQRFVRGYLSQDDRLRLIRAAELLKASPLHIDDSAICTIPEIHSKLRKLQAEEGLDYAIVDYLQLLTGRGNASTRNEDVSEQSRGLKLLAKELKIPIIALSQLSRACETRPGDHRPRLSDLRDSGSLEQDADLVGFVYREEVYKQDREDLRGLAELILAKQRNGPIGVVKLVFINQITRFENRAEDLDDPGSGGYATE